MNISIGVFETAQGDINLKVSENGDRIKGVFGELLDRILAGTREIRR